MFNRQLTVITKMFNFVQQFEKIVLIYSRTEELLNARNTKIKKCYSNARKQYSGTLRFTLEIYKQGLDIFYLFHVCLF